MLNQEKQGKSGTTLSKAAIPTGRRAKRKDASRVLKAAEAILRPKASTNYASFKRFRIEQVIKFQGQIIAKVSKSTFKPLSKSTVALSANKAFIFLAGRSNRIQKPRPPF